MKREKEANKRINANKNTENTPQTANQIHKVTDEWQKAKQKITNRSKHTPNNRIFLVLHHGFFLLCLSLSLPFAFDFLMPSNKQLFDMKQRATVQ